MTGTSAYPAALDTFSNPLASDPMNSSTVAHAALHTKVNDALKSIQTELGVNARGSYSSVQARLADASYSGHGHTIANITGLQAALDGKAASSHTHVPANVSSITGTGTLADDLNARGVLATTVPAAPGTAAVGTSTTSARSDHVHPLPTLAALGAASTATSITAGSGLTGGGTLAATRTLAANFTAAGGDAGTAVTVARGDHLHDGRYYTETESDAKYALVGHNHDGTYAKVVAQDTTAAIPAATGYPDGTILAIYS